MTAEDPNIVDAVPPEGQPIGAPTPQTEQPVAAPPEQQWTQPAYTPTPVTATPAKRRPGVWFGFILIILGAAIIADRLVPGLSLWSLWPLLIVAAGLKGMFSSGSDGHWRLNRITEGLVTVALGAILFGNTTGAMPWSIWLSVFSLWPLLLVSAGIDIIGKSLDNVWLRVFSSLVVLAGLLYGALIMPAGTFSLGLGMIGTDTVPFEFSEPAARGVRTGSVGIEGAVGSLTVADGKDLIAAEGRSPYGEPTFEATKSGRNVEAQVSFGERGVFLGTRGDPRMDVTLSRGVAWDLDIDTGVSSLDADLSDLDVRGLTVSAGVSECEITLGELADDAGMVDIAVEAGLSTVTVRIPSDTEASVSADGGLSTVGLPDGSSAATVGGTNWESDGFDDADNAYRISFDSGIASVKVEYY